MRFRLFRRGDIVTADGISLSRWERLRRNFGAVLSSVALASAFGLAAPSVAHAEEATIDATPEMTYEMSNDELSEVTGESATLTQEVSSETAEPTYEGGFSETVTADTTVDFTEDTASEASSLEETTVTEGEQVQTSTEEVSSSEEKATEITNVVESPSTDEVTVVENLSSGEVQTSKQESSESTSSYEETTTTVSGGFEYEESEIVEIVKEIEETQEVQEVDGKIIMTVKSDRVLTDEMLAQMVEDWRSVHFPNGGSPEVSVYNISGFKNNTRVPLEGENAEVVIDENGNTSIVKTVTNKPVATEEQTTTVDTSFEETVEGKIVGEAKTEVQEDKTSVQTQKDVNSKSIEYSETDYVVVTGKDGSITVVTKLPLSAEMGLKIKNGLIKSGKISNKTGISYMTLKQNGETVIGDNVLTLGKDGKLGIIGSDFKDIEALNDADITNYLKDRIEKDENGHIDTDKVKPDHDEPEKPTIPTTPTTPTTPPTVPTTPTTPTTPPTVPTIPTTPPTVPTTPENPTPPVPFTPTPNEPTPIYGNLPKTGDELNTVALYGLLGTGLGLIIFGLLRRKKYNEIDGTFDYDLDNLTPEEKQSIDKAFSTLTGTEGKHFDYERKLLIIERELASASKDMKKEIKSLIK